ncbi:peptide chain release factor N(5)-glutamine methyltransferase [Hymenobacter taeanensis]|uniref:Release factor glutamine methyltransferase n=1 Tax=Hymenobacter taeanensis TaxID=2735321 RepID=A0A6M6BF73_9BACT|nr:MULTISPECIES: peptide chain release factor N(5)-glutamine methyltransferase [Hymenobacter]QJX46906.1 peptide chain release factor N(5)-glutamine methyltransferase [Hymenobacter taeanensis]UOQ80779.1 peptide chain release factor N(5)-glutamine methyltransferase [Hymenobacter sp. 5414T-23]
MPTVRQLTTALSEALQTIYSLSEADSVAGLVLEHLLGLSPLQRRMQAQEPVAEPVAQKLAAIQARLLTHEPLQYVLGTAHFAGLELEVSPATLIPRPETEELVALITREQQGRRSLHILDVGTGSGCIPVALGLSLPGCTLTAVDISSQALAVAQRNAARYAVSVDFQEVDILTAEPQLLGQLDVIVSNPPYVLEEERDLMRPNVLAYEPTTALFVPNHDPLLFYRRIAELGQQFLRSGGCLYFEINERYAHATSSMLQELGYQQCEVQTDIFDKDRMARATWLGT